MGSDIFNIVTTSGAAIWACLVFVISILGCLVFLYVQSSAKVEQKPGGATETMEHKWDETLAEYNNPMPSWWRNLFYLTIIFSLIYIVLYPGVAVWGGIKNWTQWNQLNKDAKVHEAKAQGNLSKWSAMSIEDLSKDANAMNSAKLLFIEKCARCHSADGGGFADFGYPSLKDKDWLWGGYPNEILTSITNGRVSQMTPHKAILDNTKIDEVANYVLKLSGRPADEVKASAGKTVFTTYCVACHTPDGTGNKLLGGKNLTTGVFNWGGSIDRIKKSISDGLSNEMPAQMPILGKDRSYLLAAYVWSLGGGILPPTETARTVCGVSATEVAKFYFASGKADLSVDAQACLDLYVNYIKENPKAMIVISGFHDETGDAEMNAELAKNRAFTLRDALISAGVAETAIDTKKPENTLGGSDLAEARRVEITVK